MMSVGNLLVALVTYLRQAEIARVFGTSWQTDAFAVALVFPMLAQQVIAHAFGSSFIPIYSDVYHNRGKGAAHALLSRILCWTGLAGVLLVGILLLLSRELVTGAGPGLPARSFDLAGTMLRIMLPILVLNAASGILNGLITFQRRFGLVSMLNVGNVLVSLLVVVLGHRHYGIMVLPLSGLVSAVAVFAASMLAAVRFGYRPSPVVDPRDHDFNRLLRLAGPVVIGTVIGFFGPVVDRMLASFLRESSVTALEYAVRIRNIALSLLFMPFVALSDVALSEKAAAADIPAFRREMGQMLNWTSFIMVPVAALLTLLATPVVSVLFMRGSFDSQSARMVGYALAFYAPWLAQFGFGAVVSRGFYAMKDSRTPVLIGIWGIIVNVLLNFILIGPMGIGGLALATTVSSTGKTILLTWFIRRKTGSIRGLSIVGEHLRVLAAAAAMIGSVLALGLLIPAGLEDGSGRRIASLAVRVVPSLGVYLGVLRLTGSSTIRAVRDRLAARGRPAQ